jgi:D-alanyl-D-alanine carboxypeptidase
MPSPARPGHSEHQLGTVLDVTSYGGNTPWDYADWGATKAGAWMRNNAWTFGFVMSYPKGKSRITCYSYEPWHFRYVGKATAKAIHDSGLTPREWIWLHPNGLHG